MSLRLLVYDGAPRAGEALLRASWRSGARLYAGLGRVDRHLGARSWEEALRWLATFEPERPIGEIQFWGHGRWGLAKIDADALSLASLRRGHAHHPWVERVARRMTPDSLLWFRTCETFGADAGQAFATACSQELGCRVAGHTFVIGAVQSGLHGLLPGAAPHWDPAEGLRRGTRARPLEAHGSRPDAPNTIHFLTGQVPGAWFEPARR